MPAVPIHRLVLLALLLLAAPAAAEPPRLVRVALGAGTDVETLRRAGLDVVWVGGGAAHVLEHPGDAAILARLGAAAELIDPDPGRTMAARTRAEQAARPPAPGRRVRAAVEEDGVFRTHVLPPFGSGSMGGYWTSAEIKMKLDDLVASDAHDLVADRIDTIGTSIRGRPIWGLRIGKAASGPDPRPVTLMNSLTHAREPAGMQALLYFVDHLLGRYGSDPAATYLLEQRVLYIVPLVNPDGYAVNESLYTASGGASFGLWRKNARDNNGVSGLQSGEGVDLNRNFPYQWGGAGSSGAPSAQDYRGTAPASEPETRAQRDLVTALRPVTGISFHTHSDLMLFPWGYTSAAAPHAEAFREWTDELTRDNGYLGGQGPHVLYVVSGEFNDWCYGDTVSKPRMFSWTPEVGSQVDGFWPPPSRIVPLAHENLRACEVVLAVAGPWVQADGVTLAEGAMNAGRLTHLTLRARNLSAAAAAGPGLQGTLAALDAGVHVLDPAAAYPTLGPRAGAEPLDGFQVAVDDTVTPGRLLRFRVDFTAPGGFFSRDTIAVPCGTPTLLAAEDASGNLGQWSHASWGIVVNDPAHPSRYVADSQSGGAPANYPAAWDSLRLVAPLDLSAGVHAYALFDARWTTEPDYDGAFLEASLDGVQWTAVASTGTTPASGITVEQRPAGAPVFTGSRFLWKGELADLSPFAGPGRTAVHVRFRFRADGGNPNNIGFDGFNFDSLRIVVYDPAAQPVPVAVPGGPAPVTLALAAPAPNPARARARLEFALPAAGRARLEILDLQGRRVRTLADGVLAAGRYLRGWDLGDESGRPVAPGVYLARLAAASGSVVRRLAVTR